MKTTNRAGHNHNPKTSDSQGQTRPHLGQNAISKTAKKLLRLQCSGCLEKEIKLIVRKLRQIHGSAGSNEIKQAIRTAFADVLFTAGELDKFLSPT